MTNTPTGISVIIPNLNGAHFLGPCLASVFEQALPSEDLDVILIDNASTDGSAGLVRRDFPAVRIITNSSNIGFTLAVNQGLDAARSALILLLNNDTVMRPGALAKLRSVLLDGPEDVAGVQPLLLFAGNPSIVDSAGIALLPHFRAQDDLNGRSLAEAPVHTGEIWGTCFGCALIRKAVFDQCGPLDPDFFAEWDDVDFCLRARWHGYRFLLVPEAQVLHHRSPTSQRDPEAKALRLQRNQMLTYVKSLPASMAWGLIAYRFQRDLFMGIHYLRHAELRRVCRAWGQWLARVPLVLARRRVLRRRTRLAPSEMKRQIRSFIRNNPTPEVR